MKSSLLATPTEQSGESVTAPLVSDAVEQPSRRNFLKGSAAVIAAPLLLRSGESVAAVAASPPTVPWQEFLPDVIGVLGAETLDPPPTETANVAGGEAGRPAHQRWSEFAARAEPYELHAAQRDNWVFSPSYPAQSVWTYQAKDPDLSILSPVVFAHYGHPVLCRIYNDLPANHVGFGTPEISTHLHNLHIGSESDGFPGDYYSATKAGPTLTSPGGFKDHLYSNIYAGYDEMQNGIGDYREALGTLFYHDHTTDFTAPNIVRGLVGFYCLFDALDSGNERDPTPGALRLPSHPYDYPLGFADRRFDADGMLYYDQVNPDGVLGDKVLVNGKIEPVLRVARRKYRLRLLNEGPSRFYQFYLVRPNNVIQPFTYIANDGNLLERPLLNQTFVRLGVAERGDIVVDFSRYPLGTELYVVNRLTHVADDTRRPDRVVAPGVRVLKIVVDREPPEQDLSQVPSFLRPLRPLPTTAQLAALPVRRFVFERRQNMWAINGQFLNINLPRAEVPLGSMEIWELSSIDNGWDHPIHIHLEEGRILSKTTNGRNVVIPAHERGRKDVYVVNGRTTIRVLLRFRDYKGKYVMHCHNLIHEDHSMMLRWDVV
ncbi:MAG: multicopper oxidase domain-containing protein [Gammaproteobacteria bacterium]|nr:multicopper oxidase domain-containing protein [Gammaproteobacteria bacterium]MBU1861497.1 multicopper oxidase domain-containing protein [Gammaproteobacteria bacterium]